MKGYTVALALVGLLLANTVAAQTTASTTYCAGAEGKFSIVAAVLKTLHANFACPLWLQALRALAECHAQPQHN